MFRFLTRFAAAVVLVALVASLAPAQSPEKGRRTVVKLFADVASKVADATVRVKAEGKDVALGTIVDTKGYILTKGDELRGSLTVRLRDGSVYDAEYIGYDKGTDLAMLKIDATDLAAVTFADGKKAEAGNWIAATGVESEPVAVGVISAGPRKLFYPENVIEKGNKGFLGVNLDKPKDEDGARITRIEPASAAAKAKLKVDDVILKVADKTVTDPDELRSLLEAYKPGDTVPMLVKRGEDEMNFKVKLGARSDFDRGEFQNKMGSSLSNRRTGFPSVIQTDTVLKPTDCGGPLVDLDGNVLGINIARAGRVETWALPGEVVRPLIAQFKDKKFPPPTQETKAEKKSDK